jgi:hypothetical protein
LKLIVILKLVTYQNYFFLLSTSLKTLKLNMHLKRICIKCIKWHWYFFVISSKFFFPWDKIVFCYKIIIKVVSREKLHWPPADIIFFSQMVDISCCNSYHYVKRINLPKFPPTSSSQLSFQTHFDQCCCCCCCCLFSL